MRRPGREQIEQILERAYAEDLPDITSEAIFSADDRGDAFFMAKEPGVLAGLPFATAAFAWLDSDAEFEPLVADGSTIRAGDVIANVRASVRALLAAERTALNLLQRASGIASTARMFVETVAGTKAKIVDTRKTAPGLRALDKYAVEAGGGINHRIGLHDMFLIKNNHIDRAGSIAAAVERIRARQRPEKLMIEVRDLRELHEALDTAPDYILLDNMDVPTLRRSVEIAGGRVVLEASGGVTLDTVRAIAETGVDRISVGALTHSVRALDISMRIRTQG